MAVTDDGTPYVEPGDPISGYPAVSQELAAVIDSLRTMIPVGAIFPYAGKIAPEGYLMCDGKAYTRTDFYDLYVVMAEWVGEWGGFPGGNSAQFYVPDFRGRMPMGETQGIAAPGTPVRFDTTGLGQRGGDQRLKAHWHVPPFAFEEAGAFMFRTPGHGAPDWPSGTGDTTTYHANTGWNADQDTQKDRGVEDLPPFTVVNFIVWTGTTTAGKNPVPGVELPAVTTRMMIEARLEQAGIGEEEIEMLREQLKELETADA